MSKVFRRSQRFGSYELFSDPVELYREGVPVSATPKALGVLAVLVQNHGTTVSKTDLLNAVWPDTSVEEATLSQNVYLLRRLLAADFPDQPSIKTVSKIGYRFDLPVHEPLPFTETAPLDAMAARPAASETEVIADSSRAATPTAALLSTEPSSIAGPQRPNPRRHIRLWWTLAALGMVFLAAFAFSRSGKSSNWSHWELTRFTSNSSENRVTAVAISSDGRLIAYADADGVALRSTLDVSLHAIRSPHLQNIDRLAWFPDQLHLLLSGEDAEDGTRQVWKLSVTAEAPLLLKTGARLAVPSHDGSEVAFTTSDQSEVWIMGSSGETPRRLLSGGAVDRFTMLLWTNRDNGLLLERHTLAPEHTSDDKGVQRATIGFRAAYERVDLGTGHTTASQTDLPIGDACLTKDDQLLYSLAGPFRGKKASSVWRVPIDPSSGAFRGTPETAFRLDDDTHFFAFGCDATAALVAAVRKQGNIGVYVGTLDQHRAHLDGVKRLSDDSDLAYPHGWSADGKAVLYESRRDKRWQIYTQALDRHDPTPLISMIGWQTAPRLTADRRWLLFLSKDKPGGKDVLFRVPAEGGSPEKVPSDIELKHFRCPQRKGSCLAALRGDGGMTTYFLLDPIHGLGAKLFQTPASWGTPTDWDISRDGDELAISTAAPHTAAVHLIALRSGVAEDLPYRPDSPVIAVNWSADDGGLLVATSTDTGSDLFYLNRSGQPTLLRRLEVPTWAVPSPDGRKLAFVDRSLDSNVWVIRRTPSAVSYWSHSK